MLQARSATARPSCLISLATGLSRILLGRVVPLDRLIAWMLIISISCLDLLSQWECRQGSEGQPCILDLMFLAVTILKSEYYTLVLTMPVWPALRSRPTQQQYATLLSAKGEGDRLSPVDNTHLRRVSSAQSGAYSSASSVEDDGYSRHAVPAAVTALDGGQPRAQRETAVEQEAPQAVQGSRASFSATPTDTKKRSHGGKKLSLGSLAWKGALSKGGPEKKAAEQDESPLSTSPPSKSRKKEKKEVKEAQTVLQLITGLDTIYLPFTNLSLTPQSKAKSVLPDLSSKEIKKLKGWSCLTPHISCRDLPD